MIKKQYIGLIISSLFFVGCSVFPENTEIVETKTYENIEIELYPVLYVFDGDTFETNINGKKEKIRILGIDTPEVDGGFRTADCYGDDASKYAKEYLKGKNVAFLTSKIGDEKDKYGRLLRYVFVDGVDFGAHLIETGYAENYKTFPHDRRSYYNQIEKTAQNAKIGMWNSENCSFWGQEN